MNRGSRTLHKDTTRHIHLSENIFRFCLYSIIVIITSLNTDNYCRKRNSKYNKAVIFNFAYERDVKFSKSSAEN